MSKIVCAELDKLIQSQTDPEEKTVEYQDVFTDFATEDFINKNIRVRPVSGITHGDETKDGRQSNISRGQPTEGENEGEDNYNKFAILELEDQRKAVKKAERERLEELRKKKMQEEKEKEKKNK